MFRFPDVAPLPCAMDATIVQCRGVHFAFPPSQKTASDENGTPGVAPQQASRAHSRGVNINANSGRSGNVRSGYTINARSGHTTTTPNKPPGSSGMLLEGVTLDLTRKSRVVLVGRNGSGKSTLLKLIAAATGVDGEAGDGAAVDVLVPTKGSIVRNHNARVGLFTQVGIARRKRVCSCVCLSVCLSLCLSV